MINVSYDVGAAAHWLEPDHCQRLAVRAERAGFRTVWVGDHFLPWFHTGAHSPQAWVWMASVASKTRKLGVGTAATVPMFKYHPAVVAQAFGTLGSLFPGRIRMIVGTGEAINEHPFIDSWPPWSVRSEMLVEAVTLMRKYWTSEDYFSHRGKYFLARNIFCYDKPRRRIPVYFSAYGPRAASIAGKHGDGLVTWGLKFDYTRQTIIPSFEAGARSAGREPKRIPKIAWIDIGYGDPGVLMKKIRRSSAAWFIAANYDEPDPRRTEKKALMASEEEIARMLVLSAEPDRFTEVIERCRKEGMTEVILSDSSVDPARTITVLGRRVLPHFMK